MSALEAAFKALNKKFGKNYIGLCSEILDADYVRGSLGVLALDHAIGGGLPERKVIMLAGKESSGKTTTALLAIASEQRKGETCILIDVEHGFDVIWATKLGVDVSKLIIAQSQTIEQISDTMETLIMTQEVRLIVLDSVAAAPSSKELDDSADQKSMGGTAKVVGLMMKKITARLNDVNNPVRTSVLLLNQIRDNVGGWGAPEYIPGGRQLHFQCDIIVWLRPDSKPIGGKDNPLGITVKFKVSKNRTAPPFKTGTYDLLVTEGKVDNRKSSIEIGVEKGVISKVGYKYSFGDKQVTDIRPFMAALTDEDYEEISKQILALKIEPEPLILGELEDKPSILEEINNVLDAPKKDTTIDVELVLPDEELK